MSAFIFFFLIESPFFFDATTLTLYVKEQNNFTSYNEFICLKINTVIFFGVKVKISVNSKSLLKNATCPKIPGYSMFLRGCNELNSLVKLKCFFSYSVNAVCVQLNKNKIEIYIFIK